MPRAPTGPVLGARAAYIGGCAGTACVMTDRDYGVPAAGTMAHSWVQMFDCEYDAFRAYAESLSCRLHPAGGHLQRDEVTACPMPSGWPKKCWSPWATVSKGVRIDSGDIAYVSKRIRENAG